MISLYDEFRRIVLALEEADIPYAICGGLAMAAYGYPRATQDVDLLIAPERIDDAAACLGQLGYMTGTWLTLGKGRVRIYRMVKADPGSPDYLIVDMLAAVHEAEDAWRERRRIETGAGPVWFASRRGIIAMKRLRSSAQDLADIERLEGGGDAG
jgi:hypothetical protein